jgi:hypothetical protein
VRWKSLRNWDLTIGASSLESPNLTDEAKWSFDTKSLFQAVQAGCNFQGWQDRKARVQMMVWRADELPDYQLPEGAGLSVTVEQELAGRARAYLRYAGSRGEAAPVANLMTLGFAQGVRDLDRVGVAVSAGDSSANSGQWQGALEIFYRHQAGPTFQITPDVQIVCGDDLGGWRLVAGVRASFCF